MSKQLRMPIRPVCACAVLLVAAIPTLSSPVQNQPAGRAERRDPLAATPDVPWSDLVPAMRKIAAAHFPPNPVYPDFFRDVRGIDQTAYFGPERIPVALVMLQPEGASTTGVIVYTVIQGAPALARFREREGAITEAKEFLDGSSVMHSDGVDLLPEKDALYSLATVQDSTGMKVATCQVVAYRWDAKLEGFAWDRALNRSLQGRHCGGGRSGAQ